MTLSFTLLYYKTAIEVILYSIHVACSKAEYDKYILKYYKEFSTRIASCH